MKHVLGAYLSAVFSCCGALLKRDLSLLFQKQG